MPSKVFVVYLLSLILKYHTAYLIPSSRGELYILTGVLWYSGRSAIIFELFLPFLSLQFSGLNDFDTPTTKLKFFWNWRFSLSFLKWSTLYSNEPSLSKYLLLLILCSATNLVTMATSLWIIRSWITAIPFPSIRSNSSTFVAYGITSVNWMSIVSK